MIYERFYSVRSDGDICTMYSDRTLINRRNVVNDPKNAYAANRDFLILEVKARVIAAAMEVLGFESNSGTPTKFPIPEGLKDQTTSEKRKYLHKVASKIVEKIVFSEEDTNNLINGILNIQDKENAIRNQQLTTEGRFPCRFTGCTHSFKYDGKSRRKHELTHNPPPVIPHEPPKPTNDTSAEECSLQDESLMKDDVYNYNCGLLSHGMVFLNFLDAVREGDGPRIMRQYKYLLLYCKADKHSSKYALECLYQMFLINTMLSPRDAHRYIWNRSVNNHGILGKNIPLDLEVEHSNHYLKQAVKNLGPNVSPASISRICKSEKCARTIINTLQESVKKCFKSGKHTNKNTDEDLKTIVEKLVENHVFEKQNDRTYQSFNNFDRNPLLGLDMSMVFKWINEHKENIKRNIKAR